MNVADLFRKQFFPDFTLVAGTPGLGREVTSVSVMDSPDVDQWLRGGEFVIGNGYIFKDAPEEFVPFFERLSARNAAAVGMKFGRFHEALPPEALATADRLSLPIIDIPIVYRWTDIMDVVYSFLCAEKNVVIRTSWSAGWNVERSLSELARELGRDMLVDCPQLDINTVLFSAGGKIGREKELFLRLADANIAELSLPENENGTKHMLILEGESPLRVVRYSTVYRGAPIEFALFLKKGENMPSLRQERLVDRAFSLLRFELSEWNASRTRPDIRRFLEYLCLGIFYGDENIIKSNALKYGVHVAFPCRVVLSRRAGGRGTHGIPGIEKYYWTKNVCVSLLESTSGNGKASNASVWEQSLQRYAEEMEAYVVLGKAAGKFSEIEHSYGDAWQLLNLIRELHLPPGVYEHDSFALFEVLNHLGSSPWAREVWEKYWSPLTLHSVRGCMSMDIFAAALISADYNLKQVSEELHIHYNTARKYAARLESLLGLNLSRATCRFVLSLAWHTHLTLHDRPRLLQNTQGNGPPADEASLRRRGRG